MKKLFVFLSIFAVLFVSSIRPLNAAFLDDTFTLTNGKTYYLICTDDALVDMQLIATSPDFPIIDISPSFETLDLNNIVLACQYRQSSSTSSQFFDIPLTYLGTIDSYSMFINDSITLENPYVFSFVWSGPTVSNLSYDDSFAGFDNESPMPISIYDTIYSLVNKYVFGNNIESGSHQDLTATILSTTICVLVFALPFLIIWKVIKIIMG